MSKTQTLISPDQHLRIAKALGRARGFTSPQQLVNACDEQRRALESATRRLSAAEASVSEVRALRRDLDRRAHEERMQGARAQVAAEDAAEADYAAREIASYVGVSVGELI
ncbi:MAG TPA: hypothetical protein VIL77_04090 [Gaiellaceae bacterium]